MLLVHIVAKTVTIWSCILIIQVSCLFTHPLCVRRCHNITRRDAGVLESSAGQPRCDGTAQGATWYTMLPPPSFSGIQEVRGLMLKTSCVFCMLRPLKWCNLSFYVALYLCYKHVATAAHHISLPLNFFIMCSDVSLHLWICMSVGCQWIKLVRKRLTYNMRY